MLSTFIIKHYIMSTDFLSYQLGCVYTEKEEKRKTLVVFDLPNPVTRKWSGCMPTQFLKPTNLSTGAFMHGICTSRKLPQFSFLDKSLPIMHSLGILRSDTAQNISTTKYLPPVNIFIASTGHIMLEHFHFLSSHRW